MEIAVLIIAVLLAAGAAVGGYLFAVRRTEAEAASRAGDQAATAESMQYAVDAAVQSAVAQVRDQATAERDAAVAAVLEQVGRLQARTVERLAFEVDDPVVELQLQRHLDTDALALVQGLHHVAERVLHEAVVGCVQLSVE